MSRHDYFELSYVSLMRQPVRNTSERYKRLAQQGYLERTKQGYVITPAGRQALEKERDK
jgi:Mn-dependent DtxR family transcriptional regulator